LESGRVLFGSQPAERSRAGEPVPRRGDATVYVARTETGGGARPKAGCLQPGGDVVAVARRRRDARTAAWLGRGTGGGARRPARSRRGNQTVPRPHPLQAGE